ncbi:MAG: hypothetical protein DRP08_01110, partial [Candidatus Aenigmatarchaeota archaeon]
MITKRDGTKQTFDHEKITKAVLAAFNSTQPDSIPNIEDIVNDVVILNPTTVEEIQDAVEDVLIAHGYKDVAKVYMLYRAEREHARSKRLTIPTDAISNYIHASKYARYRIRLGRRETFNETVDRVLGMHERRYPQLNMDWVFDLVRAKRVLPSMRSMQFGGSAIETINERLYNCTFTHINKPEVFGRIMYLLLCGSGVGYSVQWQHVAQLPEIQPIGRTVKHVTIPDNINGWAKAIEMLFATYFFYGFHVEFDYSVIRDEGTPLVTSGGRAPGHLGLKSCIEQCRLILDTCVGRKLRPIECYDLICHIAEAVLSGGIRRSSTICLFSHSDSEMLYAKSPGNFDPNNLNTQRTMSNNSAVLLRSRVQKDTFDRILDVSKYFGDPGFVFVDHLDHGINPCGEIGLDPVTANGDTGFAYCNLTEVNVAACDSEVDLIEAVKAAALIGTLQA